MKAVGALISLVGVMLIGSTSFAATCPESVPAPRYENGDRFVWTYTTGTEKTWQVAGVDGSLTQVKWSDPGIRWDYENAGTYFLDQDWVITKGINKRGKEVLSPTVGAFAFLGKKVLGFPLYLGKVWEFDYIDPTIASLSNMIYVSQKVVGCEEVTTPAGKFQTLKIEGSLTNSIRSGWITYYSWYSPEAKNIVKFHLARCVEFHICDRRPPQSYELTDLDLK